MDLKASETFSYFCDSPLNPMMKNRVDAIIYLFICLFKSITFPSY